MSLLILFVWTGLTGLFGPPKSFSLWSQYRTSDFSLKDPFLFSTVRTLGLIHFRYSTGLYYTNFLFFFKVKCPSYPNTTSPRTLLYPCTPKPYLTFRHDSSDSEQNSLHPWNLEMFFYSSYKVRSSLSIEIITIGISDILTHLSSV